MKKLYTLREGEYDPTFLKALAIAVHLNKLDPAELEYWLAEERTQQWMAVELYKRFKPK